MFRSSRDITNNVIPADYEPKDEIEEDEQFYCDLCSEGGWGSDTELVIHQSVAHTEKIVDTLKKNPNYCRICIKNCHTGDDLLKHIKSEHFYSSEDSFRVQREIFICDFCEHVFFNKDLLIMHIINIHIKNKPYSSIKCPKCPKHVRFKTLYIHLQSHGLQSVSTCPVCLIKCKSRKHVLTHMKVHPRYLKCEMCSYETKRDTLFEQHILTKHKLHTSSSNDDICYKKYFVPVANVIWKYRKSGIQGLELMNGIHICIMCREICVDEDKMRHHILVDHCKKEEDVKASYICTCGEIFTNRVLLKHHTFKLKGNHKMLCEYNRIV